MEKLVKSKEVKELHFSNIFPKSCTEEISKFEASKEVSDVQPLNIPPASLIVIRPDFGKITFFNELQRQNIQLADIPKEKSKFDKSTRTILLQPIKRLL